MPKMRKRGKRYERVQLLANGKRLMAYKDCRDCNGRGHVGRSVIQGTNVACGCLRTMPADMPIDFITLSR